MSEAKQDLKPTRRRFLLQVGQMVGATFLAGCTLPQIEYAGQKPGPVAVAENDRIRPPLPDLIRPQLGSKSITLDQQIGQMIMAGFDGKYLSETSAIVEDVRAERVGGVALFGRNVESIQQLQSLTSILQQNAPVPLLISIDQEGGSVRRLGSAFGMTHNYSAAQLGSLNDLKATAAYAKEIAQMLRNLGINLNLAPVVDVNVNPFNPIIGSLQRSFSSDPATVAEQALTFIQAHHTEGVFCTIKHFPGHGSSTADSHVGFVDVTSTWTEDELTPFERIITAGSCDAVMTAHIYNARLDKEQPATLSKATITGLLRQRMGYDGVIMTDDIQMGAIRQFYDFETAIALAVEAGVDMFAISRYSPAMVTQITSTIHQLVQKRRINEERIYQSYKRIVSLKSALNVRRYPTEPEQIDRDRPEVPEQDPDYLPNLDKFLF